MHGKWIIFPSLWEIRRRRRMPPAAAEAEGEQRFNGLYGRTLFDFPFGGGENLHAEFLLSLSLSPLQFVSKLSFCCVHSVSHHNRTAHASKSHGKRGEKRREGPEINLKHQGTLP